MKKWLYCLLFTSCLLLVSCQSGQGMLPASSEPGNGVLSSELTEESRPSSQQPEHVSSQAASSSPESSEGVLTSLPEEEMERLTQMFNIFWIAQADVQEGEEVPLSIAYTPFMLVRDTENTVEPEVFEAALRDFWGRDVPLFEGAAPAESLIPLSLEDGKYFLPAMGLSRWHETTIEAVYSLGTGRYKLTGTAKYKELGEDGFSDQTVATASFEAVVQYEEDNQFHFQVLSQQYHKK